MFLVIAISLWVGGCSLFSLCTEERSWSMASVARVERLGTVPLLSEDPVVVVVSADPVGSLC